MTKVITYFPKERTRVECFIKEVWVCSNMVIGALRGVGTYDF